MQSYKVYIGNATLYFGQVPESLLNFTTLTPPQDWKIWVSALDLEAHSCWIVAEGDCQKNWEFFNDSFKRITAAGGRVENEEGEVLFIFRRGKWDLPKGKVDKGESIIAASVREVQEECGLKQVERLEKLGIVYHMYFHKEKWVLKDTHWFRMLSSKSEILIPQGEEDITAIEWINPLDNRWQENTFGAIMDVISW